MKFTSLGIAERSSSELRDHRRSFSDEQRGDSRKERPGESSEDVSDSMLTHSTCKLGGEDGSLRSTTTINS